MAIEANEAFVRRVRLRYEWGRIRFAATYAFPVLAVPLLVVALVGHNSVSLALGLALYVMVVALLWWGRTPGKSVLPGVVYGLLPLAGALVAKLHPHMCHGSCCYSTCLPVCVGTGVVAGLLAARMAIRSQSPLVAYLSIGATAFITGSLGGSCVGVMGVFGMLGGIAIGLIPVLLRPTRGPGPLVNTL